MSRVHDMGGRFGDGPVDPEDNATFEKEWHKRALAMTVAAGAAGAWNIDSSRHMRELLGSKDYGRFSYYEKWMAALADLLVDRGLVTEEELKAGRGDGVSEMAHKTLRAENVQAVLAKGSPYVREGAPPSFAVGDRVKTRRPARNETFDGGHTRQPGYSAGASGEIVIYHGAHVFPDSHGHYQGEAAQPLYAVRFTARELWGAEASEHDEVVLDMWESYLEATS